MKTEETQDLKSATMKQEASACTKDASLQIDQIKIIKNLLFSIGPDNYSKPISDFEQNSENDDFKLHRRKIKLILVRYIYLYILIQHIFDFGMVVFFTFNAKARMFANEHYRIIIVCGIILWIFIHTLNNYERLTFQSKPLITTLLVLRIIIKGIAIGVFGSVYDSGKQVMLLLMIIIIVNIFVVLYTFQNKLDFDEWKPYFYVTIVVLLVFGALAVHYVTQERLFPYDENELVLLGIISLGALLISFATIFFVLRQTESELLKVAKYIVRQKTSALQNRADL